MSNKWTEKIRPQERTEGKRPGGKTWNIILSIALAIILWAYVIGEVNPETQRAIGGIPLRVVGTNALYSQELVVLTELDETVTAEITGRRRDVYQVGADKLSARLDVSDCVEGENRLKIEISAPESITKAVAREGDLLIIVDRVVTEQRNVKVNIEGRLNTDSEVSITSLSAEMVGVTGPSTYVAEVDAVVGVLSVKNSIDEYSRTVALKPVDKNGDVVEGVTLESETVEVEAEKRLTKTVEVEVTLTGEAPEGTTVSVEEPVTLNVTGDFDIVRNMTTVTAAPIDISGIQATTEVETQVSLPAGVSAWGENKEGQPTSGTVTLKVSLKVVPEEAAEEKNKGNQEE